MNITSKMLGDWLFTIGWTLMWLTVSIGTFKTYGIIVGSTVLAIILMLNGVLLYEGSKKKRRKSER